MATAIQHKDVGDVWTPQATFTVGGTPTDPSTLTVRQQDAAGAETVLLNAVDPATLNANSNPVAKTSTGVFVLKPGISLTASGYWFVKWQGTGAAAATEQHQVIVDPDEFTLDAGVGTRALVSLAETKDWLEQRNIDTNNDLDLVRVINDISDRFHYEARREFKVAGTNPQTRVFEADPYVMKRGIIQVGDLVSYTLVEIIDTDWTSVVQTVALTDVVGLPIVRESWEPIRRLEFSRNVAYLRAGMRVRVTGVWGFPAVPGNVRQAVLDTVAAIYDRDVEQYRQDFSQPAQGEAGNVIVVGTGQQRILALPLEAQAVAWSYRDPVVG